MPDALDIDGVVDELGHDDEEDPFHDENGAPVSAMRRPSRSASTPTTVGCSASIRSRRPSCSGKADRCLPNC